MQSLPIDRRILILLGGLIAGTVCYLLTQNYATYNQDLILAGLCASGYAGCALVFIAHQENEKASFLWSIGLGGIIFLIAFQYFVHIGYDEGMTKYSDAIVNFFVSLKFALFVSLAFLQSYRQGKLFDYLSLYKNAWHNAVLSVLPLILVGLVFAALHLASALFKLIGLTFLQTLLMEAAFNSILAGFLFAVVVIYLRENEKVLAVASKFCVAMFRVVGLVICSAALIFLIYLPIAGLDALWKSGLAATIILTVVLVTGFYANAYIEDGVGTLWPKISLGRKGLVTAAVAIMPVFVLLGAYAFYLRIEQYGLTPDRVYAFPVLIFALMYSLGYCVQIIRYRFEWVQHVRKMNVFLSLFAASVALLMQLSFISPYEIASNYQINKLMNGSVVADEFDYAALKFSNAKPGRQKFDALVAKEETLKALGYTGSIDGLRDAATPYNMSQTVPVRSKPKEPAQFITWPEDFSIKGGLGQDLLNALDSVPLSNLNINRCIPENTLKHCVIWKTDSDGDGFDEFIVFAQDQYGGEAIILFPGAIGEAWTWRKMHSRLPAKTKVDILDAIKADQIHFGQPEFPVMKFNDTEYLVSPQIYSSEKNKAVED